MKQFEKNTTAQLLSLVDYDKTKVASRVINENNQGTQIIMAMDADTKLDDHSAPADVTIYVAEGEVTFTVEGKAHRLSAGDVFTMTPGQIHSVVAHKPTKILLTKLNRI